MAKSRDVYTELVLISCLCTCSRHLLVYPRDAVVELPSMRACVMLAPQDTSDWYFILAPGRGCG